MAEPLVSVIVPVYNAQNTIETCMRSILGAQGYENYEVLAVDDGSTDQSLALLRGIAERQPRLHVLSQPNRGVAAARNRAIELARGEYIQFVDSDDSLLPVATAHMVAAIQQPDCDMVIAPYKERVGKISTTRGFIRQNSVFSRNEFLDALTEHPNSFFYAVLWNKLYRRSIIRENNILCDPSLYWGEDFAFNTRYYRYIRNIATLTDPVYTYARNPRGLALSSGAYCVRHPIRSVKLKLRLQAYYDQLFRDAGLYDAYRHVLHRYLFGFTISR